MNTPGVDDDQLAADVEALLAGREPRRLRPVDDETRAAVATADVVRFIARVRLGDRCSSRGEVCVGRWTN